MRSQQLQHLAVLPALGHGPVRGLEVAHRLRPLALGRVSLGDDALLGLAAGGLVGGHGARAGPAGRHRRVGGRVGLVLRGPVVYVPVVFVEEEVKLRQLLARHGGEVGCRKG